MTFTADQTYRTVLKPWPEAFFINNGLSNPYADNNISIRLEALQKIATIPGDIIQCGVYKGDSVATLGVMMQALGLQKKIWACDTFSGFPIVGPQDEINGMLPEKATQKYFADTNEAAVTARLKQLGLAPLIKVVSGSFAQTLPTLPVAAISLLILDCDVYESYMTSLTNLYPRLSSGGVIIFDEYYSPKYPGARQAVDEFFRDKVEKPQLASMYLHYHPYERWYLVKAA